MEILRLSDKELEIVRNMFKEMMERMKKKDSLTRDLKSTERNQMEILELKYTVTEIKNSKDELNRRGYVTEEKPHELEARSNGRIQTEHSQKEREYRKEPGRLVGLPGEGLTYV